jgi:hypothetical protein
VHDKYRYFWKNVHELGHHYYWVLRKICHFSGHCNDLWPAPADAMSDLSALVVKCKWGDVKLDQIIEWSPAASPSRSRSPTVSWGGTPLRSRY